MDAQACLKKLEYVGALSFATVDDHGAPQIRNISAIHYEPDAMYFFTARGKVFCRQLLGDGRVQVLGYTKYNEMIRLSGKALPVPEKEQSRWIDTIFEEQPYLSNVYPGTTREIGIVFCIQDAQLEYFDLGVHPILRERFTLGSAPLTKAGYVITDHCIGCGACQTVCPQSCIVSGTPYLIDPSHCLHCGACTEHCPVKAVKPLTDEAH